MMGMMHANCLQAARNILKRLVAMEQLVDSQVPMNPSRNRCD